jgi:hypothetical protein
LLSGMATGSRSSEETRNGIHGIGKDRVVGVSDAVKNRKAN